MKKREWDKDIFNYDKAREWLRKNHLPVLFFLAILAIPILLIAVRYAVTHFPSISDAAIANKLSKNSVDFVTPALYYFSSIAQTMGAIIGLALAAMYAIMPNIRSSKDNPAFEPARRLLQRDEYFRRSINVGSVCILVSIVGLLVIYVTASSQSWAFVLLLFLGVTALGLGVYSLGTMFYFIRVRMPKYFSPVEILEFAFENGDPNKVRAMNEQDALDYSEISIFIEANGIHNRYTSKLMQIIDHSLKDYLNFFSELLLNLRVDIEKSGTNIEEATKVLSNTISALFNLINDQAIEQNQNDKSIDKYQIINYLFEALETYEVYFYYPKYDIVSTLVNLLRHYILDNYRYFATINS